MKTKLCKAIGAALVGMMAVSCTTSYDAYGNPQQSVDPLAAAAVAGVAGYAIGHNNGNKNVYVGPRYGPYYGRRPVYRPRYHRY